MYEFVTGPLAWIAFLIFFFGLIARAVWYVKGLNWQLDRVAYRPHMRYGLKGAARSIFYWLFPYGTRSWRQNPVFTFLVFIFHIGLLLTPVFLLSHNILLKTKWGFSLPTLSETTADVLTIAVIASALFLVLRRIALTEVRIITSAYDYLLVAIAVAPFVTGLLARYQVADYQSWLIVHILCGEIFLIAIPLTKLSHFVLFFMSRAQLGMDYGIKRGGMKGKGLAW
jgi:nitrate reductase gamma subunit